MITRQNHQMSVLNANTFTCIIKLSVILSLYVTSGFDLWVIFSFGCYFIDEYHKSVFIHILHYNPIDASNCRIK